MTPPVCESFDDQEGASARGRNIASRYHVGCACCGLLDWTARKADADAMAEQARRSRHREVFVFDSMGHQR